MIPISEWQQTGDIVCRVSVYEWCELIECTYNGFDYEAIGTYVGHANDSELVHVEEIERLTNDY